MESMNYVCSWILDPVLLSSAPVRSSLQYDALKCMHIMMESLFKKSYNV